MCRAPSDRWWRPEHPIASPIVPGENGGGGDALWCGRLGSLVLREPFGSVSNSTDNRWHLYVQVDAVQQRTGNCPPPAFHLVSRTAWKSAMPLTAKEGSTAVSSAGKLGPERSGVGTVEEGKQRLAVILPSRAHIMKAPALCGHFGRLFTTSSYTLSLSFHL